MAAAQGLRAMARCATLEHLDLSYSSITAVGLAHLRPLRRLSSLVLVDCLRAVHPPCMMLLAELPALQALDASNNKRLDDGCLQVLPLCGVVLQCVVWCRCVIIGCLGLCQAFM